jgi:hypothetical protein
MCFQCTLMDDPVVAADGRTYDRESIELWLKQHNDSPCTGKPLEHKMLIPNMDKRRQINSWREEHGLPALIIGQPVEHKVKAGASDTFDVGAGPAEASSQPQRQFRNEYMLEGPVSDHSYVLFCLLPACLCPECAPQFWCFRPSLFLPQEASEWPLR